jgi:acid phosphatase
MRVPFAVAAPHRYDHVVIVVEENRTPGQIIGDTINAPYLTSLAAGGVSIGRMFAIEHPSQPNYLQLFSGSNQGVLDDNLPPDFSTTITSVYPFKSLNLGAELVSAGFTFAGYSEQLESAGATDYADYDPHTATDPGVSYRRKHNPWANWVAKTAPVPANQLAGSVNKAFTQFPSDFTSLPTVSFVIPNQMHDMHDGTRKQGDDWIQANLKPYAEWAKIHNSLLIVTWDEDDYNATNQIPTIFYGAALRDGTVTGGTWTLHNLLRTLEDMYGVTTHAGSAAQVQPIAGPFTDDPPLTTVTFRQGLNGYASARDTMLWEDAAATNNATMQDLTADYDTNTALAGSQEGQVLIRFDNVFGSAAGQIPSGVVIQSAKLILNTPANITGADYDSNDTFRVHRMISDWTDTATWNTLSAGVAADNTEASSASTFSLVPDVDGGPSIFDVTSDVKAFQAGTPNRGWVVRPSSTGTGDGWTFKSSEALPDTAARPSLEVTYATSPGGYTTWQQSKFGPDAGSALAAETADPDRDGMPNLAEYATGTEPLSALSAAAPVIFPGQPPTFSFRRATAPSDVRCTVQVSPDLQAWQDGSTYSTASSTANTPVTTQVSRAPSGTGLETITVKPVEPSPARRYLRLKVTRI